MRVTIQRVSSARVTVGDTLLGAIQQGLLLLVGFAPSDDETVLIKMAQKISKLRVFEDNEQKMNLAIQQVDGQILSISQFTLYADTKKGNRPSFQDAAKPELATKCYDRFNQLLSEYCQVKVATGKFGAEMKVELVNDGPVTINLEFNHD